MLSLLLSTTKKPSQASFLFNWFISHHFVSEKNQILLHLRRKSKIKTKPVHSLLCLVKGRSFSKLLIHSSEPKADSDIIIKYIYETLDCRFQPAMRKMILLCNCLPLFSFFIAIMKLFIMPWEDDESF